MGVLAAGPAAACQNGRRDGRGVVNSWYDLVRVKRYEDVAHKGINSVVVVATSQDVKEGTLGEIVQGGQVVDGAAVGGVVDLGLVLLDRVGVVADRDGDVRGLPLDDVGELPVKDAAGLSCGR